jgi:hypothetical protein
MNGKKVWLAMQEFGRPLNLCPEVDSALRDKIETEKADVNSTQVSMEVERKILEANKDDYCDNYAEFLRNSFYKIENDFLNLIQEGR